MAINASPAVARSFRPGTFEAGGGIACRVAGDGPLIVAFASGAPGLLAGALAASWRVMAFDPAADVTAIAAGLAGERCSILAEPGGAAAAFALALAAEGAVASMVLLAPEPATDIPVDLAAIKAPALLLFGTRDRVAPPANGRLYAERMAQAYVTHVYDAGHPPDDDRLDAVLAVVKAFLDGPESFTVNKADERRYA